VSSLLVGSVVRLDFTVTVDDVLTDPSTVALTVELPDGTFDTGVTVIHGSTGSYHADYVPAQTGWHVARWVSTGTGAASDEQSFQVRPAYSSVIKIADVKARLNKTVAVDDDEIQDMLDAAVAEYEQLIGPVSGTVTEKHDGGSGIIVLGASNVSAVTAATYTDGTTITVSDLDVDTATGIVGWGWNTAGWFTSGRRNVTITYTVGALPANHREAIVADVAGYFEVTQRGGAGRPSFAGEAGYEAAYAGTPTVLFPRIRELAKQFPSVA
jgi:hypothetical protein